MATRPEIALQQRPSGFNLINSLTGAQNVVERFQTADFRKAILEGQANQVQQQNALSGVSHAVKVLEGLQSVPLDQRAALVAQQLPVFEQLGIPASQITSQNLSDAGIEQRLATLRPIVAQAAGGERKFQFGESTRIKLPDGSTVLATQRRDPISGEVTTVTSPIEGQIVSSLGETPEERAAREVTTATEKQTQVGDIQIGQAVEKEEATREGRLTTAQALADIENASKRQQAFSSQEIQRIDSAIETGLSAVSSLPDINRGLELLRQVETGGLTARAKTITDFFGTTSGDVGELNNILARNVLDGLSAFTGAISEGERAFIERMNTNLAAGTEFNIAQLNRLRNIYQREIKNGLKAAEIAKDEFAVGIFTDAMAADPTGFAADVAGQAQSNEDFVNGL